MHVTCHQAPLDDENLYPQTMVLEHFKEDQTSKAIPKNWKELHDKHYPVALTYMEMYPGGAGCKMLQFKYLENVEFRKYDKDNYNELYAMPREERIRRLKWEGWMNDWKSYIEEKGAFIEGQQDGWAGPIVSYWGSFVS